MCIALNLVEVDAVVNDFRFKTLVLGPLLYRLADGEKLVKFWIFVRYAGDVVYGTNDCCLSLDSDEPDNSLHMNMNHVGIDAEQV
jgi:hypothetical protein